MIKTITINSKRTLQTKKGKDYIGFTDMEDNRYSVFDASLFSMVVEGATVSLDYEEAGDYVNIKGIEVLERPAVPVDRDQSIRTQVAAKIVAELWSSDKLEVTDCEVKALREWLRAQFKVTDCDVIDEQDMTIDFPDMPVKPALLVEEAKKLGAVETPPPEFKNVGEFLMAAYKQFGKTRTQVLKLLNIEDTVDLTDFTGAWVALQNSVKQE